MSRRYKSSGFKFYQPLSGPESKTVYECYGMHGKGYGKAPPFNSRVSILCMHTQTRELQWADGLYTPLDRFTCDSMLGKREWKMLGWAMADGSLPWGELDRVDPSMTQIGYLPVIDSRDCTWRQIGEKN